MTQAFSALSNTSRVTILIPTLNRPEFAIRLLQYYHDNGFCGRILLGDSSGGDAFSAVQRKVQEVGPQLDAVHVNCAGKNTNETLAHLNAMVDTPYVAFSGDDDYIIPSGLAACVAFLDANADYVAAQGRGRGFELDGPGAHGRVRFTGPYRLRGLERESAAARLAWHLLDYTVTIFAVHRTPVWRNMWAQLDRVPDRTFGAELLPVCLSVVYGKMKLLPTLYLLRQAHAGNTDHLPHVLEWFASPAWAPSYRVFLDTLASEISRIDGTPKGEAETLVRTLFREYVFTDRSSLGYWGRRIRMSVATPVLPVYWAIERSLPARAVPVARAVVKLAFMAPFRMVGYLVGAPLRLLRSFEQRKAEVVDKATSESSRARRAAKKSASANEAQPHA